MDYFLQEFGNITISRVVLFVAALFFLFKIYKQVKKYFSEKAINEKEKNDRIQAVIEQAEKYPEWHQQSIQIRENLSKLIEGLDTKIDKLQGSNDERMAYTWRYRILRFNDEIRLGEKHSKEHFDQIIEDIDNYEDYCRTHPDFPNNKAVFAISHIKKVYQKCINEKTFL